MSLLEKRSLSTGNGTDEKVQHSIAEAGSARNALLVDVGIDKAVMAAVEYEREFIPWMRKIADLFPCPY